MRAFKRPASLKLSRNWSLSLISITIFLMTRIYSLAFLITFDGDRIVRTWMQFPDIEIMNSAQFSEIFFKFHASAPGLPLIYSILYKVFDLNWWIPWYLFTLFIGCTAIKLLIDNHNLIRVSRRAVFIIVLVFISLNPVMIVYEAQFYSTAIVAYLITICWIQISLTKVRSNRQIAFTSILLFFLCMIRPSITIFGILLILCFALAAILRSNSSLLSRSGSVALILFLTLIISLAQGYRIKELGIWTFQSSAATGTFLGLGFENLQKPSSYGNYYPFIETRFSNKSLPPDILLSYKKSNGLENWNSILHLLEYKRDNANFTPIIFANKTKLPSFLVKSLHWASTDPLCSRVIEPENLEKFRVPQKITNFALLGFGSRIESSELKNCEGQSRVQLMYLLILGFFLVALFARIRGSLMIFRRPVNLSIQETSLIIFELLIILSIAASFLNGSPEVSKYRVETTLFVFIYTLRYFPVRFKTKKRKFIL